MKQKFYFIAALLLISHFSISQLSAAIREGECGENLTWTLDTETGALTITGSGEMTDYQLEEGEGSLVCIDGEWQRLPMPVRPWSSSVKSVSFSGEITHIGNYAFYYCPDLTTVIIPTSVTSIGMSAFSSCSSMASITIPNSVTSIKGYAFAYCRSLTDINVEGEHPASLGDGVFSGTNNCPIYVDCGYLTDYKDAWSSYADRISYRPLSKELTITCDVNIEKAGTVQLPQSECDDMVITATAKSGYHFVQWSDGKTDNPRTINPDEELSLTAIFALTTNGTCGENNQLNWVYDEESSTLTISGSGRLTTNYTYNTVARQMQKLIISDGVTEIGSTAFVGCSNMTSVTIPNTVTSIGDMAFYGCSGLTSVHVCDIAAWCGIAFSSTYADYIPDIRYTSNPLVYAKHLYKNNTEIINLVIPNSVTSIGAGVFYGCSSLISVTIPNSVTSIGGSAFAGCSGLTSVHISDIAAWCRISFSSATSNPLSYAAHLYMNGKEITDLVIPNSVTSIGNYAFSDCAGLTSTTIPNSVTSIGDYAFSDCMGLTSVTIPNSVTSIGSSAFYGVPNIVYSGTATGSPWGARYVNAYVEGYLIFSDETKTILLLCSSAATGEIVIPNSVTSIEQQAFYGCSAITSVIIPNGVTTIGFQAFRDCSGLTSITIPNSVTSIGYTAFLNCSSLRSVTIPNSITNIETYTFSGCSSLTSVTIPNSVTTIGENAFSNCSALINVTIGNSVTGIRSNAFANCSALKYVYSRPTKSPTIYSTTFPSDLTVFVPNGSKTAYESATYWSNYTIKEAYGSTISNTSPTSVSIIAKSYVWDAMDGYVASCGIEGGETFDGNTLEIVGLKPETEYTNTLVMTSNTGETETINVSFVTSVLELITQESKAVSSNTALLFAKTNMSDAEVNCGFEWKRSNAPDDMAGTKVYCPVANGTMAGRLKNLNPDVYYKYRAFYESSAGNKYYGDWQYIFTGDDAVEFDPVMYTYPASAVTETTATLKGYALAGSDEFTEQGFEYWVEVRIIPVNANNAPKRAYHSAVGEHMTVAASGISMKVTLTDLDEGSVYKYRTYAVVDGQKVYGEEQSFTTRGEYLYTVTFVDYDGSVLGTDKVHYGEAATAPNDPAREGYNFSGWDIDFSAVTDDITVTAVYSIATALPDTQLSESAHPRKLIKENQLLILRDGKTYTVHGLEVR